MSDFTAIAIDIGSTRTHVAAVDAAKPLCVDKVVFDNAEFDVQFMPSIKKLLSAHQNIRKASVSSCIKKLAGHAEKLLEAINIPEGINIVNATDKLPITIKYENQQALGADRICNAAACAKLFAGHDAIIIDSGTAITVDLLREGKFFEGGAILPGVSMQLSALYQGTDSLPSVNLNTKDKNAVFPASSTKECIKAGVLYGTAGAIEKFIGMQNINDAIGKKIVATGGGWEAIEPYIDRRDITFIPDLTLMGAAVIDFSSAN